MAESFEELKQELLKYDSKIKQEDDFLKAFNSLNNNQILRSLCNRMQKAFPKNPSLQDTNAMIYVYTNLNDESIKEKDREDWIKQLRRFAKKFPDNNCEEQRRLYYTMASLKKAKASPTEAYEIGKKLAKKITPDSPYKQVCEDYQYENADNFHKYLLNVAQDCNFHSSYQEQTKAFERAAKVLFDIKPTIRKNRFTTFADKMHKHFMQSEWGRVNFIRHRNNLSKKIHSSLPSATQEAIKNNIRRSEYNTR